MSAFILALTWGEGVIDEGVKTVGAGISFQRRRISLHSVHCSNDDDDEFGDVSGHYLTER